MRTFDDWKSTDTTGDERHFHDQDDRLGGDPCGHGGDCPATCMFYVSPEEEAHNEALQLPVSATPEAHEHIATLWAGVPVPEPPSAAEVDEWEAFYARLRAFTKAAKAFYASPERG